MYQLQQFYYSIFILKLQVWWEEISYMKIYYSHDPIMLK